MTTVLSADKWFAQGRRVYFDPYKNRIVNDDKAPGTVAVFERTRLPVGSTSLPHCDTRWLTLLPDFFAGSYGYAKVDQWLENHHQISIPRLYIEYIGQGDSDKPKNYHYSTMERADLVQAQWRAHCIKKTVVVALGYSSLVLMELLRRQQENAFCFTQIEHVLIINGVVDTHPWLPFLQTPRGRMCSALAQHSNLILDTMLKPLYSKTYRKTCQVKREMREVSRAIRRHSGSMFLSNAAGFVDEHEKYVERWNLRNIYHESLQYHGVTIRCLVTTSEQDSLEHCAEVDLTCPQVPIECIGGGYFCTAEKAPELADRIAALTVQTRGHHYDYLSTS